MRINRIKTIAALTCLAAVGLPALTVQAQTTSRYSFRSLFDNTTILPGGGTFDTSGGSPFAPSSFSLNNGGQVAFSGSRGLFASSTLGIQRLLTINDRLPGGGTFNGFLYGVDINNNGRVAFTAAINFADVKLGRYTADTNGLTLIAREDAVSPDGGIYQNFAASAFPANINDQGDVAFWFETTQNRRGSVFLNSNGVSRTIASFGQSAPGGGTFRDFDDINLNNNGDTVFDATTTGGSGYGVFKFVNGSGVGQLIVARGQAAAGGGTFNNFLVPDMNDSGNISFRATTLGGPSQGVYRYNGTNTLLVAATGQQLPDGQLISGIRPYTTINNSGSIAFAVTNGLTNSSAIQSLYVASNSDLLRVIGLGDELLGSTVTQLGYGRRMLNDDGQVVVSYVLTNGRYGVALATPTGAVAAPEPGSAGLLLSTVFLWRSGVCSRRKRAGSRKATTLLGRNVRT